MQARIRNWTINTLFLILTIATALIIYGAIVSTPNYVVGLGALKQTTVVPAGGTIEIMRLIEAPQSDLCRITVNRELLSVDDTNRRYSLPGSIRATAHTSARRLVREYRTFVPPDIPPGDYVYLATAVQVCRTNYFWTRTTVTEFEPFLVTIIFKGLTPEQ